MNQLVLFVLNEVDLLYEVLSAWQDAGIRDATVLDSLGMRRIVDVIDKQRPIFTSLAGVFQNDQYHYTLLALVNESVDIEKVLAATERVTGDLDTPNTGVFAVLPVSFVKGLRSGAP